MDAPEAPFGLHNGFHGLGKALVLLLHLRQQADAVIHRPHVHGEFHPLIRCRRSLFLPLLHPQAVPRDDVGGGLGLLPGLFQGPAVGLCLLPALGETGFRRRLFLFHGSPALRNLGVFRLDSGMDGVSVGGGGHGNGLPGPEGFRLALGPARLIGSLLGAGQKGVQCAVQFRQFPFNFRYPGLLLHGLPGQAASAAVGFHQILAGPADVLPVVPDIALQHRHSGGLLLGLPLQSRRLGPEALRLHILLPHPLAELLALGVKGVQIRPGLIPLGLRSPEVRLQLAGAGLQGVQVFQPHGDLQKPQFIPQNQIFFRLLRLIPQGLHL